MASISEIIEGHKARTTGHVLCWCGLEFKNEKKHRAHITQILEENLESRTKSLEKSFTEIMTLCRNAVEEGELVNATVYTGAIYRIISDSFMN